MSLLFFGRALKPAIILVNTVYNSCLTANEILINSNLTLIGLRNKAEFPFKLLLENATIFELDLHFYDHPQHEDLTSFTTRFITSKKLGGHQVSFLHLKILKCWSSTVNLFSSCKLSPPSQFSPSSLPSQPTSCSPSKYARTGIFPKVHQADNVYCKHVLASEKIR